MEESHQELGAADQAKINLNLTMDKASELPKCHSDLVIMTSEKDMLTEAFD